MVTIATVRVFKANMASLAGDVFVLHFRMGSFSSGVVAAVVVVVDSSLPADFEFVDVEFVDFEFVDLTLLFLVVWRAPMSLVNPSVVVSSVVVSSVDGSSASRAASLNGSADKPVDTRFDKNFPRLT